MLASRPAYRGAGADVDRGCRMQLRHAEPPFRKSLCFAVESTASAPQAPAQRHELPQYARPQSRVQSQNLPPPIAAPQSYPSASSGMSGGGRGISSYAPPAHPIEATGSVPHSVAAVHPAHGTTIIVGTSDTLEILARRYNVTPAAILQANGYKGPRVLSPGQQLIIPRPARWPSPRLCQCQPAGRLAIAAAASSVHVVNHGDTLMGIARRNHISAAELARANGLAPGAKLKIGMKLNVPVKASAAAGSGCCSRQWPRARRYRLRPSPGSRPSRPIPGRRRDWRRRLSVEEAARSRDSGKGR